MTHDPNAYDLNAIDPTLLDEALAEPTSAELEAKIVALTDPQMLSLLDEAMSPEPADNHLTQRILFATQSSMTPGSVPLVQEPDQKQEQNPDMVQAGVLARIRPAMVRYAAAAGIALAVGLGLWFTSQPSADHDATIADQSAVPSVANPGDEASLPEWLSNDQYTASTEAYFKKTTSPLLDDALEDAADSLDGVSISRDTLWAELDAYEQFLEDFES